MPRRFRPTARWHHAAATYDGATWRLYLDGVLDGQLVVGSFIPRADSIQHAAIGSGLQLDGQHHERSDARVLRRRDRRSAYLEPRADAPQISRGRTHEITNAPGLLGRWSFNEGTGTILNDSTGRGINGTITGTNWAWVAGAPFSTRATPRLSP